MPLNIVQIILVVVACVASWYCGYLMGKRKGRLIPYYDEETANIVKGDYLKAIIGLLKQNTTIATTLAHLSESACKTIEGISRRVDEAGK